MFMLLGNILQTLPQLYISFITLGGQHSRDRVHEIKQSLKKVQSASVSKSNPGVFMKMTLLLGCHADGLEFLASHCTRDAMSHKFELSPLSRERSNPDRIMECLR